MGCPKRFVLGYMESGKFNVNPTHCSILMSSGYVYPYSAHGIIKYVCACVHIGVGFGVVCSGLQAIPEP